MNPGLHGRVGLAVLQHLGSASPLLGADQFRVWDAEESKAGAAVKAGHWEAETRLLGCFIEDLKHPGPSTMHGVRSRGRPWAWRWLWTAKPEWSKETSGC